MTLNGWLQILFYSALLLALTKPLGIYMVRVYDGSMGWLRAIERPIYKVCGIDPTEDQHWTRYAGGMLLFSVASMLLTYLVLRLQAILPLNPAHLAAVTDRQSFETAASFTTNTNWQSYGGRDDDVVLLADDTAHVSQLHLGGRRHGGRHRADSRHRAPRQRSQGAHRQLLDGHGPRNALHPASAVGHRGAGAHPAGRHSELQAILEVTTLEGAKQVLAMGPASSQIAIKQIGTNGGGFFNVNSAHPFENPTPWSNFIEMFSILASPRR